MALYEESLRGPGDQNEGHYSHQKCKYGDKDHRFSNTDPAQGALLEKMGEHHCCYKKEHKDHENNSECQRASQVRRDDKLKERHEIDLQVVPGFFQVKALYCLKRNRKM